VLCEDLVSDRDLDAIAARMVRGVGRPIRVADEDVTVGLSLGTAQSSGSESAADLVQLADSAMYAAKQIKP
jgi:GGDEF domain-containing protein